MLWLKQLFCKHKEVEIKISDVPRKYVAFHCVKCGKELDVPVWVELNSTCTRDET